MLRVVVVRSSKGAKQYYSAGDYYSAGQELPGEWGGIGAAHLGLTGTVERGEFAHLCDNFHPRTGQRFTLRTNVSRRVAFDLNWHVPKSFSVLFGLTQSAELLTAFRQAVEETMCELEARAQTRVRIKGANQVRTTGNLTWASYVHTTARPVGGVPDPHLHCHAVVFNATFDPIEGRWKALDLCQVKRAAPYFEAAFHARLAAKLRHLGYDTVRTSKGWELAGVPRRVLEEFSRRTKLIERVAEEQEITNAHAKDAIGALTRERKSTALSLSKLCARWRARITGDELRALELVAAKALDHAPRNPNAARDALHYAVEHCFERESAVSVDRLLAVALRRGVGEVAVDEIRAAFKGLGLLVQERNGVEYATAREVLAEEIRMLAFARDGRGTCARLVPNHSPIAREWLSNEQKAAVAHVLGSRDRVTLLRGAAGVGKTALMIEAVEAIEKSGTRVIPLAPSAAASRGVLRAEGFSSADTVARFLVDAELQERARGHVIWIDEAGLLGTVALAALFDTAGRLDARVVLVGDTRQHSGVARGTALKLLEREAGLDPFAVTGIRRQHGRYREAVGLLSEGRAVNALDVLDRLGWVRECDHETGAQLIAAEYLLAHREGKSVLVVSPTHAEGERVTRTIRTELLSAQVLSGGPRFFPQLVAANFTIAERSDAANYEPGMVLQFFRHAPGFRSASRWVVVSAAPNVLRVQDATGDDALLPLPFANRFQVFESCELELRIGDRVRFTNNERTRDGHRLDNGAHGVVKRFTSNGDIQLESGAVVPCDVGHVAHGYCVTSHASQGRTVDRVLVSQSAESFAASSVEQLYVSVSRGRERVLLITDDKAGLRLAAERSDPRPAATEIFAPSALWRSWAQKRIVREPQPNKRARGVAEVLVGR